MKMRHKFALVPICIILFISSCDKGFEEMNKNPNAFVEPNLKSLFSYNVVTTAGNSDNNTLYPNDKLTGCYMQYFASLNTFQWTGDKYVKKDSYDGALFISVTNTEVKENQQLLNLTKDKPELSNLYNINRIWHAYIFHRGTDMYGDIPYSEAGRGLEGILKPKYDKQSFIYPDMLKELDDAASKLVVDPAKTSYGSADYLYSGNITKWKTFAYSLMLRLGLRLSKIDPAMSKLYVQKAIAGGVMKSNADIAKLNHVDGTAQQFYWDGRELRGAEGVPPAAQGKGYGKMNKTFVDYLKNENDPRLAFYITLWQGNADPSKQSTSTLPASQRGMPGGYDNASIKNAIPTWNDAVDLPLISEFNLNTIGSNSTPTIFQEFAEVEFYLAEAALRGWGPGTPKEHFEKAIRANMAKSVDVPYPGGFSISTAIVDAYLAAHPYNTNGTFEQQMKQIHTELWAALFMNNMEVYANWRRTGYPILIPTNYVGNETNGTIPRRVVYPQAESTLNKDNYAAAVAAQGPDAFTTRMWWDKP
jgi:Starch-binding associating with outer membrane